MRSDLFIHYQVFLVESCEKLIDINLEEKYDYIIAIGTAEYAEKLGFYDLGHMLEWMYQQLEEDGTILFSIDNRFGTKYLAGSTRNKDEENQLFQKNNI